MNLQTESRFLAVKQAMLIAHMTGILWLRRNPVSLVFTAISPFSLLFVLFVVSHGQYVQVAVAGSIVMALVGYGLSLGQDISFYKTEYKIQDIFVASEVSPLTYMMGLALSELMFGLPALAALCSLLFVFGAPLTAVPAVIANVLLIWASMSALGFFLSSHMLHMRNATQVISFVNVLVAVLPPVYYSALSVPEPWRTLTYAIPTTHASLLFQSILGERVPSDWSPLLGFGVQLAYLVGFISLAKVKAMWREH